MGIYANEDYTVTKDNGVTFGAGESGVYETWCDTTGELFRAMQKEYGRCTGKVYVDRPASMPIAIGWVFQKRREYDDFKGSYLAETWITVLDKTDNEDHPYTYHNIEARESA